LRWQSAYWIVSKRHNRGKTQWKIKSFILQSVDIGGIVDHHCLSFLFIITINTYIYTPRKHSFGGYIGIGLSVCLSGPTSTSFVRFPPNFVEFKIMMCELCSIKDFIFHWVLPLLCLFETIQYALCHRKFSYMSWSGQTDRQTDSYIPPKTMFAGGINICINGDYEKKA
jgi:hypothetical protein